MPTSAQSNPDHSDTANRPDIDLNSVPPPKRGPGKPRGKPFEPGNHHGKGRQRGSRNKKSEAQEILDGHATAVVRLGLKMAFSGDRLLAKTAFERVTVPAQPNLVDVRLPRIRSLADLSKASEATLQAVAQGRLSLDHAKVLMDLIHQHARLLEGNELEDRLVTLEHSRPTAVHAESQPGLTGEAADAQ